MDYRIIHELPERLRIRLSIPKRPAIDHTPLEKALSAIPGVRRASFNGRTGTLLVVHDGCSAARSAVLKSVEDMPLTLSRRGRKKSDDLRRKRRAMLLSAATLLASPLLSIEVKLFLAVYGAAPIFRKALSSVQRKRLNVDVLDCADVGVTIGIGDYGAAGTIMFLLKVGEYLDERTRQRSRESLARMFSAHEEWAWVRRNGKEIRINVSNIAKGDHVVVRTGGRIPVDGVVVEGEAIVNQSSMTGEPMPVMKRRGVMVYAGTALEEGRVIIETLNVGDETRVARILSFIEESEGLKADVQNQAERLADRFVPYSFLFSGLTYAFTGNMIRAASVLTVDYSCAIKLSTPLAVLSGMQEASNLGVLIKGGKFMEKLAAADAFVLDKTGTLTEARPKVVDVVPLSGYSRDYLLQCAACVEEHFPHPVATAVVRLAEEEGLSHFDEVHAEVEYVMAHGIASAIQGKRVLMGSRHFIHEDNGIGIEGSESVVRKHAEKGRSFLYIAIGASLAGIVVVEDPVRKDAAGFVRMLTEAGIEKIIMLTGDHDSAAKSAAERLGIKEYHAQVFPEKKMEIIRELRERGYVVAMVGDGINDSPALANADVGISMKHGADIAREVCDVLLLEGGLEGIIESRKISQATMSRIKKNFRYIMGINSALIGLGMLGVLPPSVSALMHNATTVAVAADSLRASRKG